MGYATRHFIAKGARDRAAGRRCWVLNRTLPIWVHLAYMRGWWQP